jgi:uncharacterized protein YjbJ (UPF0337 family)
METQRFNFNPPLSRGRAAQLSECGIRLRVLERHESSELRDPIHIRPWSCLLFSLGADNMKESTKDKVEGTAHEVKGAVQEKVGRATNNPNLEDQGTAEKVGGKVQKKVGELEKVAEK